MDMDGIGWIWGIIGTIYVFICVYTILFYTIYPIKLHRIQWDTPDPPYSMGFAMENCWGGIHCRICRGAASHRWILANWRLGHEAEITIRK